jgi:hypothetical protein
LGKIIVACFSKAGKRRLGSTNALRRQVKLQTVEYVVFEDEGHGFVKKGNQIEAYNKILDCLDKYLKKEDELKG